MALVTPEIYIDVFGRLETIQLMPVNNHGGDMLDYDIDLTTQPYLLNAIADANEYVSVYINNVTYPHIFSRNVCRLTRAYLHFRKEGDSYIKELKAIKDDIASIGDDLKKSAEVTASGLFLVSEYPRDA